MAEFAQTFPDFQIVSTLLTQLQQEYETKSFELRNIQRMMQFAQTFPDFQIVSTLLSKLSWSYLLISTERQPTHNREMTETQKTAVRIENL